MRLPFLSLACALGVTACFDSVGATFRPETSDASDVVATDAADDHGPTAPDVMPDAPPASDVRDVAQTDTPLFVDSGSHTPVCGACAGPADCGADGVCVQVATGSRACLPRCNPDVPVCPGRLRCVRDVALSDVAVCAPVGGVCCIDGDGDGYGAGVGCRGADCDDANPMRNATGEEACNGADDDCDGMTDENLSRACTTACGGGAERCERGAWTGCTARAPVPEVCGNGADDDCDGMTDEGCACMAGATRPCYPGDPSTAGRGRCRAGTERCASDGSAWGACEGAVVPTTELCANSVDDDCDGMTDEGCATGACGPSPVRWNLPAGTVGSPDCITRGGGYCEGTAYCSGASCYTSPPGGCGEPHCGTLRCNDGSYVRERYCSVRATCSGGAVTATGFTW